MNSTMDKVPVEKVQKFYENKGFTLTTNDETGDTHMEKNCSFTAKYFISDKGGDQATEPTWRTSPSGKEYCLLMGIAKVKKMATVSLEPKLCILNKTSDDIDNSLLRNLFWTWYFISSMLFVLTGEHSIRT